jgi:hypothetical protein
MPDKELNSALLSMERKHRFYNYLLSIGASMEAANLISQSADELKRTTWDGVAFGFRGSDLQAVDDPAAKAYFHNGPFAALFTKPKDPAEDNPLKIDPVVLSAARAGNMTARSILARDSFNSDPKALDAYLASGKVNGADKVDDKVDDKANDRDANTNPWRLPDTDPKKQELMAAKILAIGTKACTGLAKAANCQINGRPLQ